MARMIAVPASLLTRLSKATRAFRELEDFLLAGDAEFLAKMRRARASHVSGHTRPLRNLKRDLCIE